MVTLVEFAIAEFIRLGFIIAGFIMLVWIMRPVIRKIREPLPTMGQTTTPFSPKDVEFELEIPQNPGREPVNIIKQAKQSPTITSQIVRQWLRESGTS